MGQLSNLPPGCSSPDGGIDHEFEEALEAFCGIADTPEKMKIACTVMPVVFDMIEDAYTTGFKHGGEAAVESLDAAMEKAIGK